MGHLAQYSEQSPEEGRRHPGEEEQPVEERYPGEEELHEDEQEHLVGKVTLCDIQDIWESEIWKNLKPQSFTWSDVSDFVSEYPFTNGLYQ